MYQILSFILSISFILACGSLIWEIISYRDRLNQNRLPSETRTVAVFGTMFILVGNNGGSPYMLMGGLIICIGCDLYVSYVRKHGIPNKN